MFHIWFKKCGGGVYASIGLFISIVMIVGYFQLTSEWEREEQIQKKIDSEAKMRSEFASARAAIVSNVKELQIQGKYIEARTVSAKYSEFNDPELTAANNGFTKEIRIEELTSLLSMTPETETKVRKDAYEELSNLEPSNRKFSEQSSFYTRRLELEIKKIDQAYRRAMQQDEQAAMTELRSEVAAKKTRGVYVGMNMTDALASSWGRPRNVRRTIVSTASHEQWIYGGGNYLYFENGLLTAIQN